MSKYEDGSYGSLTGVALLGKILAGRCGMKYTRAAVGNGAIPEDRTPKTMEGPAGYVMDAKIAGVTNPVDGECQVTVQIKSDNVKKGFYATNIVLFAEDPDLGEVPYTYLSLENEPEWIRPASSIVGKLATFDLIAAVGDVDTVTAVIDPEAIAVVGRVEKMIKDHDTDPNAHADLRTAIENLAASQTAKRKITIPASAWAKGAGDSYAVSVALADVNTAHTALVILDKAGKSTAAECGMDSYVETTDGVLLFQANTAPSEDIHGQAVLFGPGGSGSGMLTAIPIATSHSVGGVKASDSLKVDPDGTAHAVIGADSAATAEDVGGMLNEVFGAES